mmetsp:Transcript_44693/g.115666  ORF Transcript_44693/g.115666 Transcript_44693/m.115666 type:complete len:201 (-) Transcript_44693:604-1206(-)
MFRGHALRHSDGVPHSALRKGTRWSAGPQQASLGAAPVVACSCIPRLQLLNLPLQRTCHHLPRQLGPVDGAQLHPLRRQPRRALQRTGAALHSQGCRRSCRNGVGHPRGDLATVGQCRCQRRGPGAGKRRGLGGLLLIAGRGARSRGQAGQQLLHWQRQTQRGGAVRRCVEMHALRVAANLKEKVHLMGLSSEAAGAVSR